MKKAFAGVFIGTCLVAAAHGAANVFDDAVFWFRGGKECVKGDGYMQKGEFFDDLNADDNGHDSHNMSMSTAYYTNNGKNDFTGFLENAVFKHEQVVFPASGTGIVKDMQVLHISNVAVKPSGKSYYFPFVVNPRSVFAGNNISNEYTIVSRIRLDDDAYNRSQCFLRLGYDTNNLAGHGKGMWLGFKKSSPWYAGCMRITGYCTPNSDDGDRSFQLNLPVPTNTWVDLAVVVGNGKLRVGVASPASLSSHNNNPTIAFDQTDMWTDNCTLVGDCYRLFCLNGQTTAKDANGADQTCFIGSVQQMAIWKRALSDQEVMAAFGMPRPAIFRTGLDNGSSSEFGGERSASTQTIEGLGSWRGIWDAMSAGDEWNVTFDALRDEAGLPQIFSIRSLPVSSPARVEVALNGTSFGVRRVGRDSRVFWPVAANLVEPGANTLTLRRVDDWAGTFRMDSMELGGSIGIGTESSNINDGRTPPDKTATGVPSAADPNTQHWPQGLQPYSGITNLHFRVWVDPDAVNVCPSRLWMHAQCGVRGSGYSIQGDETFSLFVNNVEKAVRGSGTSWEKLELEFAAGELQGGWNDVELKSAPYDTCHWLVGYYRFQTVLPKGFSIPPPGTCVLFR